MSTTNLPASPSTPPDDSLPQQQQFDSAANAFNTVYAMEQKEVAQLQSDIANMSTWAQLLEFLGALASLTQLMTACKVTSDECAESVAGVLQGAESIFTQGVQEVNQVSQEAWADQQSDSLLVDDLGVPIPTVNTLNTTYSAQVAQGELFFDYLGDAYYDVSGDAFTVVGANGQTTNPLSGIETSIQETIQDIGYQMVNNGYNLMYSGSLLEYNGHYYYAPASADSASIETYSQAYASEIDSGATPPPDYIFNGTAELDNNNPSNPMSGTSSDPVNMGDVMCYAMLNWFFIWGTQVQYTGFTPSSTVYAPDMTQNPAAYQVENDFATINSSTTGFAPQSMPIIGFLTNLTSNALAAIGNYLRDTATLSQTIISNTNG
jgi:hypothetical protein